MSGVRRSHAVVVGAGMGGLAAAMALSSHFERVSVLDRDALPQQPEPRAGTPQARQIHVLLPSGLRALAELFPDCENDLETVGALRVRAGLEWILERPGFDLFPRRDLGWDIISMPRPLLEWVFRRRVERQPRIAIRPRTRVTEMIVSRETCAVTGVRHRGQDGHDEDLPADLVVDASSSGLLTLTALEALGVPKPQEDEIGIDLVYASAVFDIPAGAARDWRAVTHVPDAPTSGRGGFVFPIGDKTWIVTLTGVHGNTPPDDLEGFIAFAETLRTRTVYDAIKTATCVGAIHRLVFRSSLRRYFERLALFPDGLLPLGDAICRFNPVFGQGMSIAAQEAALLGRLLRGRAAAGEPLAGVARDFFAKVQDCLASPWAAANADFAYPATRGDRPADFEQKRRYEHGLWRLAREDPAVHRTIFEVGALLRPRSVLGDPDLVKRVTALLADCA